MRWTRAMIEAFAACYMDEAKYGHVTTASLRRLWAALR